ncbi:derlin-1-like isoform X2 [Arachis stenosperma]|uniref:derlin-1-like isoform X2 n=1 Tax=Arachis stenosperma TaxID=217475 RepID=UPI0025ACE401|nr:derlin-1-like isoform X2 [Arachis stenosperma]
MSTPADYYRSLPPVSKTYGVLCLMTSAAYYLQLYDAKNIALFYGLVFKRLQIWRLITNFFFLGPFSFPFAIRLIMIAKYGVSLERGPFDKRTADYVWMFIFGALSLLGFYLPWALLALDLIFGSPIKPNILGMLAGHLYYFLSVLHPLAGGKIKFKTPLWVHKIVAYWGEGTQVNAPVQSNPSSGIVFKGRSHRLGGSQATSNTKGNDNNNNASSSQQQNHDKGDNGIAFRGRSYRLNE